MVLPLPLPLTLTLTLTLALTLTRWPATVTRLRADGRVDVRYDDGDVERQKPRSRVRPPTRRGPAASAPAAPAASASAAAAAAAAKAAAAAEWEVVVHAPWADCPDFLVPAWRYDHAVRRRHPGRGFGFGLGLANPVPNPHAHAHAHPRPHPHPQPNPDQVRQWRHCRATARCTCRMAWLVGAG